MAAGVMTLAAGTDDRFEQFWDWRGEWVEPPNLRRGGESGVERVRRDDGVLLYCKRQCGHLYRSLLHPFGRPTVLRERDAIRAFERLGVRVPRLVYCGARRDGEAGWQALLVTEALDGFIDFECWYASMAGRPDTEDERARVLDQIATVLARLHRGGWQHGCLYPKHIFIRLGEGQGATPDIALLDLEKSRRRFAQARAAFNDVGKIKRHSVISEADWAHLLTAYERAFGHRVEALHRL